MPSKSIYLLSILGFLLSVYALYVETKAKKSPSYKAVCDINDRMSCTKAFTSPYGKIFGVSNSISGIIFYAFILILNIYNLANYIFYLAVLSVHGSIYLAYTQYFKVKSFCLVCNGIYIINILLLVFSYLLGQQHLKI